MFYSCEYNPCIVCSSCSCLDYFPDPQCQIKFEGLENVLLAAEQCAEHCAAQAIGKIHLLVLLFSLF
jgi:hypothetical protein